MSPPTAPSTGQTNRSHVIVMTKGSDYDIGAQHAAQLKEQSRTGMVSFYSGFWRRLLSAQPTAGWVKPFVDLGKKMVDPLLVRQLQRQIPAEYRERLRGVAETANIPFDDVY